MSTRITYCGNIRHAVTRLALLELSQAAAQAIASLPPEAFEPVKGQRGLMVDSISDAHAHIPEIEPKVEPTPKQRWPSSSRQRFGGKR